MTEHEWNESENLFFYFYAKFGDHKSIDLAYITRKTGKSADEVKNLSDSYKKILQEEPDSIQGYPDKAVEVHKFCRLISKRELYRILHKETPALKHVIEVINKPVIDNLREYSETANYEPDDNLMHPEFGPGKVIEKTDNMIILRLPGKLETKSFYFGKNNS